MVQAVPRPELFPIMFESISNSRSAFEQYQALIAAKELIPVLSRNEQRELARRIDAQRGKGGWITPGTARWVVSEEILSEIPDG
jgi:hypothetical protein